MTRSPPTPPLVCHGGPGDPRSYLVAALLDLLASGATIEEIIEDHPEVKSDDLLAALEFRAPPSWRPSGLLDAFSVVRSAVEAGL